MRPIPPEFDDLARRLLAHEASCGSPEGADGSREAAERACEKLRVDLSKLLGPAGFHALLSRARVLARAGFSWLDGVQVDAEGRVHGLGAAAHGVSPADVSAGHAALLAHFFRLLVDFIGWEITLQLLGRIWPEANLDGARPGSGEDDR